MKKEQVLKQKVLRNLHVHIQMNEIGLLPYTMYKN